MGTGSDHPLAAEKGGTPRSASDPARGQVSAPVGQVWLVESLLALAAFIMFLGPGISTSFFVATVGFYELRFKTKLFFIAMLLAVYGPFPFVVAAQASFDAYFDRMFSVRSTYFWRIGFGLTLLQAIVVIWMFTPVMEGVVICIGVALGASACVVQASGHQLVSAIDPTKLIISELGGQIGSAVPLLMITILDFKPSASPHEFREFLATVIVVNFMAMAVLTTLHCFSFFDQAYGRLSLDLEIYGEEPETTAAMRQVSKEANETWLLDEPMESSYRAVSRQTTPIATVESTDSTRRNIPSWVWMWQLQKGVSCMSVAFLISLAGFYGDPAFTQFLASLKLATDCIGRLCSLLFVKSEEFKTAPWHKFVLATAATRIAIFVMLVIQLVRPILPRRLFVVAWCLFGCLDRLMGTFSDVTCSHFVEVKDRRFVSRLTFFFGFGGMILGLGLASGVAVLMMMRLEAEGASLMDTSEGASMWGSFAQHSHAGYAPGDFHAVRTSRAAAPQFTMEREVM